MRLVLYSTLADAEAAQRAIDSDAGLPRTHSEGTGPHDYVILNPGIAAASIRAHGVRTDHAYGLLISADGRFGIAHATDAAGVEIDPATWYPPLRRGASG